MLALYEFHEAEIVGTFQRRGVVYGREQPVKFRTGPFVPQSSGGSLAVEHLRREFLQHPQPVACLRGVAPCQQIAYTDGTQRQFREVGYRHQSLGILRVEKHEVAQLVRVFSEFVAEQRPVKRQLHKVFLLRFGSVGVISRSRERHESALARLLLYDGGASLLVVQKVETSLNAQHLAEESRLQHHRLRVILVYFSWQTLSYKPLYVLLLHACVRIELVHRAPVVHVVA